MGYPLEEGDVIDGRYVIGPLVGEGGVGAVYRAVHILRRAPVALKVLSADGLDVRDLSAARFVREAVAASLVESEHVVRVLDAGMLDNGLPYLVMELLQGKDLAALLRVEGTPGLPAERALHLIVQVLSALQVAHGSNVIHRDLKLSNCFVTSSREEKELVKVLDFGGSKLLGSNETVLTTSSFFLGTPAYIAPEQAMSALSADERSDLFSVGVMTYKLLSGRLPICFENERTLKEKIEWLVKAEAAPLRDVAPHVPEALCEVVHRAMRRDPAARFESALAFAEALDPFLHEGSRRILQSMREATAAAPPSSRDGFLVNDALLASVGKHRGKREEKLPNDDDGASTQLISGSFVRERPLGARHATAAAVEVDEQSVTKTSKPIAAASPKPPSNDVLVQAEPRSPSFGGASGGGYAWVKWVTWGLFCIFLFLVAHLVVGRWVNP
jgi:serine/threonine-protein kinase